ncbi:MAG TPA: hypothetical protein VJ723_05385 [Candidatus Angelobacter sp.]|nr:hypothetical protein [Candidatus Angelobacter sp.]
MTTFYNLRRIWVAVFLAVAMVSSFTAQTAPAAVTTKPQETAPAMDAREIVRRSAEVDNRNWEKARNYTCQEREVEKKLDKNGAVKSTETRTNDITFYYGQEYSRLIQKNDQPLTDKEQKKEEEKLNKFMEKYKNESDNDRQKRLAKQEKERREGRAFLQDVVNAYDFQLLGEEKVAGLEAYVIMATPRKGFHPTQPHADLLSKVKGKLWIDKKEYNWVKAEVEVIDTISFGLFIARIHKGSRLSFEQAHVNNEVWLTHKFFVRGGARLALFMNENFEEEDTFSNYKRFTTSVRILPDIKESAPEPGKPAPPK